MTLFLRYALAGVVVALDQWSKLAVEGALELYERIPVTAFLNITKAYNPGAAFSFLAGAGGWQRWFFTIVSSVVSVVLVVWLARMERAERMLALAISLILGGAVGNLIDRIAYGHVVDFIQVHWKSEAYFPSFNVADSAITAGTVLLLLLTFLDWRAERAASAGADGGARGPHDHESTP